ncbi:formylmethanofuran--tetrahydromethanopterin N-formyltransferase [Methanosphaerula subterraneus]|jgi:formylmethanofuran--tetrahydromethanopterin N-formyltransferase|uniref:formylmethanofuran--tetrahydromethanopterin N-formyltransferase n=1 Tax=Methanosphaerula subterraneus TaxID=3350244 RepID=UPI003F8586DA
MEYNGVPIDDTYAEAFPIWISRVLITAATMDLAYTAAVEASGFATSCIGCAAECGVDTFVPAEETPDGRPGYSMLICNPSKKKLKEQLIERIGECILTAPTTAAFNGMPDAEEKIPVKLHFFGDGYEYQQKVGDRDCWAIPLMGGDFIIEEEYGAVKGVAGGNFFVMGENQMAALVGAQAASDAISGVEGAITSFPGGIVASGSKVGSKKYKFMNASTNEAYCPSLKGKVEGSKIPDGVNSVFEIVIDGVDADTVADAMGAGIRAACMIPGVKFISAGNYGGSLGPHQFHLKDLF